MRLMVCNECSKPLPEVKCMGGPGGRCSVCDRDGLSVSGPISMQQMAALKAVRSVDAGLITREEAMQGLE